MAYEIPFAKLGTLTASADLRTHQYKFAKVSGAGTATVAAASTDAVVGVIQNKPNTGEEVELTVLGVTKVVAGAAVAAGAEVMSDASGRAITAAAAAGANRVLGYALDAASAAGEIITVLTLGVTRMI